MSWQATAWAERRKTGAPARKLLLMVLANYADDRGYCWPAQETLAEGTELSLDTIQRQIKRLVADGHISIQRKRRAGGRWPSLSYQLSMGIGDVTVPHDAVRSKSNTGNLRHGRAAPCGITVPQAMRHEPSLEPSLEPSASRPRSSSLLLPQERKRSGEKKVERIEVIQNRIARRLGKGDVREGWMMLGALSDTDRESLLDCERAGRLTDEMLETFRVHVSGHPNVTGALHLQP